MLVRHNVGDFGKWKPLYDEHTAVRKDNGSKSAHLFRNADNPNEILILFEWESLDKAKSLLNLKTCGKGCRSWSVGQAGYLLPQ